MKFAKLIVVLGERLVNLNSGDTDDASIAELIAMSRIGGLTIPEMRITIPVSDDGRKLLGVLRYNGLKAFGDTVNPRMKIDRLVIYMGSYEVIVSDNYYNSPLVKKLLAFAGVQTHVELELRLEPTIQAAELLGIITILPGVADNAVKTDEAPKHELNLADLPTSIENMCKGIDTLELFALAHNALTNNGILYLWQFLVSSEAALLCCKNFGRKGLRWTKEALQDEIGVGLCSMSTKQAIALRDRLPWPNMSTMTDKQKYSYLSWADRVGIPRDLLQD